MDKPSDFWEKFPRNENVVLNRHIRVTYELQNVYNGICTRTCTFRVVFFVQELHV